MCRHAESFSLAFILRYLSLWLLCPSQHKDCGRGKINWLFKWCLQDHKSENRNTWVRCFKPRLIVKSVNRWNITLNISKKNSVRCFYWRYLCGRNIPKGITTSGNIACISFPWNLSEHAGEESPLNPWGSNLGWKQMPPDTSRSRRAGIQTGWCQHRASIKILDLIESQEHTGFCFCCCWSCEWQR